MNVKLLAHTRLSDGFFDSYTPVGAETDGQLVALSAIRTCYSFNKPSEIANLEGEKYFGKGAADGKGGSDADRLFRHIVKSGHTSTLEHISFTFAIESVSRSLLAQLTRHRVGFSYSVQSQRYVKFRSDDKSGGAEFVTPSSWLDKIGEEEAATIFEDLQAAYDGLREAGIPAEDARFVLPNAATCNLVMSVNLRALLDFCNKRGEGSHAQWEIKELAGRLKGEVEKAEPWTAQFFGA